MEEKEVKKEGVNDNRKQQELKQLKPFKERFHDSWNKVDEHCPNCGAVTKPAVGINRQNIKKLFTFSTNPSDWIILFILIMVVIGAWAYNHDMAACKKVMAQQNGVHYTDLGKGQLNPFLYNLTYNSTYGKG